MQNNQQIELVTITGTTLQRCLLLDVLKFVDRTTIHILTRLRAGMSIKY